MNEKHPPPLHSSELPPIIVYTPTGRDATLIEKRLASDHLPRVVCDDESELLAAAEDGSGPLLISEEGLSAAGGLALDRILDEQPAWSDLPVILLANPKHRRATPGQAMTRRASVQWLSRPIDSHYLLTTLRLAAQARHRQQQVSSLLLVQGKLNQKLKRRADQLRDMTVQLIEAEDHERERLADLLHDDLQGMLVAASLHLKGAERQTGDSPQLRETIGLIRELIKNAQETSRSLSHELFPAALRFGDLKALLDWLGQQAKPMFGVDLQINAELPSTKIQPMILRFCYRAIREILCNTAKHAGVTRAALTLQYGSNQIELTVCDDGMGFDPTRLEQEDNSSGLGLIAMRERVEALGGKVVVESSPGSGTRITLLIPAASSAGPKTTDLPATRSGQLGEITIPSKPDKHEMMNE